MSVVQFALISGNSFYPGSFNPAVVLPNVPAAGNTLVAIGAADSGLVAYPGWTTPAAAAGSLSPAVATKAVAGDTASVVPFSNTTYGYEIAVWELYGAVAIYSLTFIANSTVPNPFVDVAQTVAGASVALSFVAIGGPIPSAQTATSGPGWTQDGTVFSASSYGPNFAVAAHKAYANGASAFNTTTFGTPYQVQAMLVLLPDIVAPSPTPTPGGAGFAVGNGEYLLGASGDGAHVAQVATAGAHYCIAAEGTTTGLLAQNGKELWTG